MQIKFIYGILYCVLNNNQFFDQQLYHWSTIKKEFIYKKSDVLDFSVGFDGSVVYIDNDNHVYIRNLNRE